MILKHDEQVVLTECEVSRFFHLFTFQIQFQVIFAYLAPNF